MLFDTGSNTSYISNKLVKQINPKCIGTRVLSYHSFGSEKAGKEEARRIMEVDLEGKQKGFNIKLVELKLSTAKYFKQIFLKVS